MSPRDALIDSPYAWLRLTISVLLATTGSAGIWIVVVVLPDVQADFGVDRAGASIPYTTTMIGFGLGNVLFGRFIDRLGIVPPVIAAATAAEFVTTLIASLHAERAPVAAAQARPRCQFERVLTHAPT